MLDISQTLGRAFAELQACIIKARCRCRKGQPVVQANHAKTRTRKSGNFISAFCLVGVALFALGGCASVAEVPAADVYTWDDVRRLVADEEGAATMDDGEFIVLTEHLIAGENDRFVFVGYKPNCGVGTCDFMLFREIGASAEKSYRLIANIFGYPRVGGDIHKGWHDIEVVTRIGSDEARNTLTYDGRTYR